MAPGGELASFKVTSGAENVPAGETGTGTLSIFTTRTVGAVLGGNTVPGDTVVGVGLNVPPNVFWKASTRRRPLEPGPQKIDVAEPPTAVRVLSRSDTGAPQAPQKTFPCGTGEEHDRQAPAFGFEPRWASSGPPEARFSST